MMKMEMPMQHEKSNETTPEQSPCSRNSLDRFNLSHSAGCRRLHSALNRVKVNLSSSCFATLSAEKGPAEGDDLTNLSWLQDKDLLKGFASSPKSKSTTSSDEKSSHRLTLKDYEMFVEEENGLSMTKLAKDSGGGKPPYSFSMLIFMAIESAPNKRLPVKDIYAWIMDNFRYFKNAPLGWKNSVRHNLSLNKCFKKVDRDKSQGVGKGSLWCIDPESRPTLLQGMRKNQVLMAKIDPNGPSSFLTTPPPSPGSIDMYSSFGQESYYPRSSSPNFDDKEFDAAAAMCTMSTPRELRAIEHERLRSQSSTPTENMHTNPELLNKWRKYIEPLSDSDTSTGSAEEAPVRRQKIRPAGESGSTYTIANLLTDVCLHASQSLKRSANGLKVEQNYETETDIDDGYDFGNVSDDYDDDDDVSDEEIDNNIKKLVERDTLGDSGYGGVMSDHSYSKTPKRAKQPRTDGKQGASMEVQALLSLANEATKQLEEIKGLQAE